MTVDRTTTALLLLDFNKQACDSERRPRCIASIPQVAKLLASARAAGVPVMYSLGGGGAPADIAKELTPTKDELVVSAGVDKFVGSDLEALLKQKGIKTVMIAGVAAHGAVLYTASGAAMRELQVIVPLDGISADIPYAEQYTGWHLVNAPRIGSLVTLTTIDDVKFCAEEADCVADDDGRPALCAVASESPGTLAHPMSLSYDFVRLLPGFRVRAIATR